MIVTLRSVVLCRRGKNQTLERTAVSTNQLERDAEEILPRAGIRPPLTQRPRRFQRYDRSGSSASRAVFMDISVNCLLRRN